VENAECLVDYYNITETALYVVSSYLEQVLSGLSIDSKIHGNSGPSRIVVHLPEDADEKCIKIRLKRFKFTGLRIDFRKREMATV